MRLGRHQPHRFRRLDGRLVCSGLAAQAGEAVLVLGQRQRRCQIEARRPQPSERCRGAGPILSRPLRREPDRLGRLAVIPFDEGERFRRTAEGELRPRRRPPPRRLQIGRQLGMLATLQRIERLLGTAIGEPRLGQPQARFPPAAAG